MESSLEMHVYSELISPRENALLFALMGPTCSAEACAVAQVYEARSDPSGGRPAWHYKAGGVVCLVWDQTLRSGFLRLFSVKRGKLLWEQELYTKFQYSAPRPFFHSFLADDCPAGLNFADEAEAEKFRAATDKRIQHLEERVCGISGASDTAATPPGSRMQSVGSPSKWFVRQTSDPADVHSASSIKHSTPANWTHDKGFDLDNLDPALQKLFTKAGIREKHLRDRHTSWLIHSVIEQHGGLEAARKQMRHGGLPPQTLPRSRGAPSALTLKKGPLPPLPAMPGSLTRSKSTQDLSQAFREALFLPIPLSMQSVPPPPSVPAPQLPTPRPVQTGAPPALSLPLKPCVSPSLVGLQRSSSLAQHTRQDGSQTLMAAYCKERDPSSTMETGSMLSALKKTIKMHHMLFADETGHGSKED